MCVVHTGLLQGQNHVGYRETKLTETRREDVKMCRSNKGKLWNFKLHGYSDLKDIK